MRRIAVIAFVLMPVVTLRGDSIRLRPESSVTGVALFAAGHPTFPKEALELSPHVAVLYGTFSDERPQARQLRARQKPLSTLLVHAMNESCRRLSRCGAGEILPHVTARQFVSGLESRLPSVTRAVERRARAVRRFVEPFRQEGVRVIVSIALESDWTPRAAATAAHLYRKAFRGRRIDLVYNPIGRSVNDPQPRGVRLRELHDPAIVCRRMQLFNNDGVDISFRRRRSNYSDALSERDIAAVLERNRRAGCVAQFVWWSEIQGRYDPTTFLPPRLRSFRLHPEAAAGIARLLTPRRVDDVSILSAPARTPHPDGSERE